MSAWLSDGTGGFRAESGLGAFGMAALLGVAQGETYHASTAVVTPAAATERPTAAGRRRPTTLHGER